MTATTRTVINDGVRLSCRDYGGTGTGRPLLLLHGLAGYAAEWDALVRRLSRGPAPARRVVAYDARGHGASDPRPGDVSREAHVADAIAVVEQLGLDRPVLVGQSLGGHTAMLAAAAHPDLWHALTLVEAGPEGPRPQLPYRIGSWLDSWPVPFPSVEAAADFFGGGPAGRAWADGLAAHPDGLRPRVDREVMVACVAEPARRSFWTEWERVRCPTLVVRGAAGFMSAAEAAKMRARRPGTVVRVVQSAAHDVHLDRPEALGETIEEFLASHERS
ncbi:alpha/beta fold hydrolase [Streptomyces sp. NPDC012623]|uniref:alpha/beta fold hydrolase n=1 Tax=unclassified Streptomyces TaxID=2593676 RepID=UPI0036B8AFDE